MHDHFIVSLSSRALGFFSTTQKIHCLEYSYDTGLDWVANHSRLDVAPDTFKNTHQTINGYTLEAIRQTEERWEKWILTLEWLKWKV